MAFIMLDGKGPLHCGLVPVVLSPVRKGVGQSPGNIGEVAMGEVRLDTGAIRQAARAPGLGLKRPTCCGCSHSTLDPSANCGQKHLEEF